tara:strand:- start:939 stop:1175 length:237 start_codon:yes stop_codon:yes gene_type:complete
MQHSHTRNFNTTLKKVAECFEKIGWDKKLNELTELQVLGIVATIKSIKGFEDEYTEEGKLEFQQTLANINELDDEIPF